MAIMKGRRPLTGVRLKDKKHTAESYTVKLPPPEKVILPMRQHIGAENRPLVSVGDFVFAGQKIGDSEEKNSVPVFASVSGTVREIIDLRSAGSGIGKAIVIASDGKQSLSPHIKPPIANNRAEFLSAVRESGIVGLGGAGFPTHLKLGYQSDTVDTLIVNAAECEPYITSDCRECIEHTKEVMDGIKLIMHHLGLNRFIIGIEKNKPDAISLLSKETDRISGGSVLPLSVIYPQGAEKILIYAATGKIVEEGKLPADYGVLMMNVATVAAIAQYFQTGIPLLSRRLTVDGDAVTQPQNVEVPIGTPVKDVLAFCGLKEDCKQVLMGGPMMGVSVMDLSEPILRQNNAVLAFSESQPSYQKTSACIRCGRCVRACPVDLMPAALERAYDNRNSEMLEHLKVNLCINCGCCTYVCPARRELASKNQLAKKMLREGKQSRGEN